MMVSWVLLLLVLTCSLCAATVVVHVAQSSYWAEENNNITMEWRFSTDTSSSPGALFIICDVISDHQDTKILYHLDGGVEQPHSHHYSGRVRCDRDVLSEGRIRLHLSRLRTDDSGLYMCEVNTKHFGTFDKCRLSVVAAAENTTTVTSQGDNPDTDTNGGRDRVGLYVTLGMMAAAAAASLALVAAVTVLMVKLCSALTLLSVNASADATQHESKLPPAPAVTCQSERLTTPLLVI